MQVQLHVKRTSTPANINNPPQRKSPSMHPPNKKTIAQKRKQVRSNISTLELTEDEEMALGKIDSKIFDIKDNISRITKATKKLQQTYSENKHLIENTFDNLMYELKKRKVYILDEFENLFQLKYNSLDKQQILYNKHMSELNEFKIKYHQNQNLFITEKLENTSSQKNILRQQRKNYILCKTHQLLNQKFEYNVDHIIKPFIRVFLDWKPISCSIKRFGTLDGCNIPHAPIIESISNITHESFQITIKNVQNLNIPNANQYRIEILRIDECLKSNWQIICSKLKTLKCEVKHLKPMTNYEIRIACKNCNGWSQYSSNIKIQTLELKELPLKILTKNVDSNAIATKMATKILDTVRNSIGNAIVMNININANTNRNKILAVKKRVQIRSRVRILKNCCHQWLYMVPAREYQHKLLAYAGKYFEKWVGFHIAIGGRMPITGIDHNGQQMLSNCKTFSTELLCKKLSELGWQHMKLQLKNMLMANNLSSSLGVSDEEYVWRMPSEKFRIEKWNINEIKSLMVLVFDNDLPLFHICSNFLQMEGWTNVKEKNFHICFGFKDDLQTQDIIDLVAILTSKSDPIKWEFISVVEKTDGTMVWNEENRYPVYKL